jgi:hypothetical protein
MLEEAGSGSIDGVEKGSKDHLAVAISRGAKVAAWARTNKVSRATAFRWAKEPDVRKAVLDCRRRSVDRMLGQMTVFSGEAVATIHRISKEGDGDAVRLKAARGMIADMISVSKFSDLEYRVTEVEQMLDSPAGAANGVRSPSPPKY